MSKIKNKYENDIDKVWYDSSNIVYSECDDKDGELKVVRITFKDGRTYEYKGVKVNDYLLFREHSSQGKALNAIMKQYECTKIDNRDIAELKNELDDLLHPKENEEETVIKLSENKLTIIEKDSTTHEYELDEKYSDIFTQVFSILDIKFEIIKSPLW